MNLKLIATAMILLPTLAHAKPGSGVGTTGGNASVGECNEDLGNYVQTNYDPNKQPRRMYLDAVKSSDGLKLHARLVRAGIDIDPLIYPPKPQHIDGPQLFDKDFKLKLAGQYESNDGTQLSLNRAKQPLWGHDNMTVDIPTPGQPQLFDYTASVIFDDGGSKQPIQFKCRVDRTELAKIDPTEDRTVAQEKGGKIDLDPTGAKPLGGLWSNSGSPAKSGDGKSLIE